MAECSSSDASLTEEYLNAKWKATRLVCSITLSPRSVNVWNDFNAFELDKETNGKSLTEVRPEIDHYECVQQRRNASSAQNPLPLPVASA